MIREHLSRAEMRELGRLITPSRRLTENHFPEKISFGIDSMGPLRDPATNAFFPGAEDTLGRFGEALSTENVLVIIATNGPDIEGEDALQALPLTTQAFAVTEGGGKLLSRDPSTGLIERQVVAHPEDVGTLAAVEQRVKEMNPVMRAMLEDHDPQDGYPPMRTPYDTNVVLTLPNELSVLRDRLLAFGISAKEISNLDDKNYVERLLAFAHEQFTRAILEGGLHKNVTVLEKPQNRRVYVVPQRLEDGLPLTKHGGVVVGSQTLHEDERYGYPEYEMAHSVYIADQAVVIKDDHPKLNPSEQSMLSGEPVFFSDRIDPAVNVVKILQEGFIGTLAEVACRLGINVTMDRSLPSVRTVQRVPILDIGSGNKALEAAALLYERFNG